MKRPAVWLSLVVFSLAIGGVARAEVPTQVDRGLLLRSGDGESFTAPIVGTSVAVRVTGIVARARVTQIFLNPTANWVEGIYVFPLPEGAVVDALRMTIGDRVLSGVVREKRQAAAVYQQARDLGHRASLVELARPGVFTTSVANLGPGEKVEITVELQQVVQYGQGRFGLRFPMVVPPRYAPAGADALSIPAPVAGPNAPSFSFHVELAPGFPVGTIDSSSHRVTVKRDERERRYAVELADGVAVADADFLLDWTPAVGRAPHAVHFTETVNGERYSLLMVLPPDAPEAAAARLPRETIFVIDTSGSMSGPSLEQAREALVLGLDRLAPSDAFNVVRFDSTAEAIFPSSLPANPAAVEQAKSWVRALETRGGTEMLAALDLALPAMTTDAKTTIDAGFVRQVIFATDGQVSNEAEVLRFAVQRLGASRLFPVAIGSAPNAAFLRQAAAVGRGTLTAIANPAQVRDGMAGLFARIETPLLSDLSVLWPDAAAEVWPQRMPDLYLGEPLVVSARLSGTGPVTVSGRRDTETWQEEVPAASEVRGAGLDKLWAGSKVQSLLDSVWSGADPIHVASEVMKLGLAHRLLTPYTSFVVVEEVPVRPAEAPLMSCRIPGAVARGAAPALDDVADGASPAPAAAQAAAPTAVSFAAPDVDRSVQDVITVTAESPLLDERRISTGATVASTELEKIPTTRDPWAILQSTPGVLADRINVGGNESGRQSSYVGPGSPMAQSTWSVDGVVMTDMAALGSSPAYYDFDAFEEMAVSTGGSDTTVATGGVAMNLVTKRGTNEWRGSGRFVLADGDWRASGERADRVERLADYGAEIGGPIVRDRFWLWASHAFQDVDLLTSADLPASSEIENAGLKLNAQTTSSNSTVLSAFDSDEVRHGVGAGPFRPQETTWDQSRLGGAPTTLRIEDTQIFGSTLYITGQYSAVRSGFQLTPRGGSEPTAFFDRDGAWHHTFTQVRAERRQRQLRADGSYFTNTGRLSHELKLGAGYREAEASSLSQWGGAGYAIAAEYADGAHALLYAARDAFGIATNEYTSAYVQDTMTAGAFTANVGVRYDLQTGTSAARSVRANPVFPDLLPAAAAGGGDAGFEWRSMVPRLGLTYAVGPERTTLLRASWSRFADQLGIDTASRLDPLAEPSYVHLLLNGAAVTGVVVGRGDVVDRNGNGVVDLADAVAFGGAYDPAGRGLLQNDSVDPELRAPMTDELLASVEHAVLPELVVGLNLTYRRLSGLLENELLVFDGDPYAAENLGSPGRLHTRGDYVPVFVSRPGGLPDGRDSSYTYWQLRPGVASRGGTHLENGDREQEYRGASLTVDKRLANRWMLRGSVTWSDWRWRVPESELEDPTRVLGGGFDGEPVLQPSAAGPGSKPGVYITNGWSYSLNALYQVAPDRPWGVDVSIAARGRQGYALPWYELLGFGGRFDGVEQQRNGIPGLTGVQVVGNDAYRLDDVHVLDAGIEKELPFRDFGLSIAIDCFNVLGTDSVLQRNHRLRVTGDASGSAPASGTVTEVVGPRAFRVGLRLRFR
jgi:Ca-activated chloride channel family protein